MKLFLKIGLGIVIGALVLLAAIGAFFRFFFDPNDIRENIASVVEERTGRQFTIEGDLELTYFPWVGMSIGRTRLGEDPAFGDGDFVAFDSASARVKVIPLLSKRIELDRVNIAGLSVNLIRDASGKDNWASLLPADDAAPAGTTDAPATSSSFSTEKIGGLDVTNATVIIDDRQAKSKISMTNFNASTGPIRTGDTAVALTTEFDLAVSEPELNVRVQLSGEGRRDGDTIRVANPSLTVTGDRQVLADDLSVDRFNLSVEAPSLSMSDTALNVPTPRVTIEAGGGSIESLSASFDATSLEMLLEGDQLTMPNPSLQFAGRGGPFAEGVEMALTAAALRASPGAETMVLDDYTLRALGIDAAGSLTVENWSSALRASGPLTVSQFSLRNLMDRFDVPVDTADPKALTKVSLSGRLAASDKAASIQNLQMTLDDTSVSGRAGISDLSRSALDFDLNLDRIDADRYLPPEAAPVEGAGGSAADAVVLPAETLRDFNANGALKIGKLTFSGIESTNVEVGINANDGKLRVFPSKASLYGGTYSGDIRIDATGAAPVLSINETVSGIDFKAFASTVMPDAPMSGKFSGSVKLAGTGATTGELKSTLGGDIGFDFADGYVEGIDLWYSVRSIVALANKALPSAPPSPQRTPFEQLKGSATMVNGAMAIESMIAAVPHLDVTGSGMVDLKDSSVDVKVQAQIVEEEGEELLPRERKLVGFRVPVFVGGTIEAPSIDTGKSVAPVVAQLAKRALADKLGLGGGDGDSQQDVEQAVEDKKEELKDDVEDKAKDLLKDLFGRKKKN